MPQRLLGSYAARFDAPFETLFEMSASAVRITPDTLGHQWKPQPKGE